ncbi:MAG: alpha/beta hydrolase [Parasphingorhabdus sp.]|nr:alpha/beta hydrolase [Parasphingorhabdus sp.]
MLLLHGEKDTLAAPEGSQLLHQKIASGVKELKLYPGLYHEIFNEPEQDEVLADMIGWLDKQDSKIIEYFLLIFGIAIAGLIALYVFAPRILYNFVRDGIRRRGGMKLKSICVDGLNWPYLEAWPRQRAADSPYPRFWR